MILEVVIYATCNMYHWSEISSIDKVPGIYAWYYKVRMSKRDIERFIEEIKEEKNKDDGSPSKIAKVFISKNILGYFEEESYDTKLEGSLKPTYEGKVDHKVAVSESLASRVAETPRKLFDINKILKEAIPKFTSPIYIGKAKNLRKRLKSHKRLIRGKEFEEEIEGEVERDEDFAIRVNKNQMNHDFLYVEIKKTDKNIETDVENILNRISFPVYGRK